MNTIKQRAHEYAQEHYLKNGVSIMRAYTAGARDERRYFIKPLRVKIFVSGKISGEDYYQAYRKFSDAEKHLESLGYKVVNPMVLCKKHWSWIRCMAVCLWHLVGCKGIYQLPDWRSSRGARIEYRIAKLLNKDILRDG